MSPETLEFAVLCVAALLIIDVAIEVFKLLSRSSEVKRSRFLEEGRRYGIIKKPVDDR